MKIKSVELETSYVIDTEDGKIYRRYGPDCWAELKTMSWEPVVFREELEESFQEYIKNRQQKRRNEALQKMYDNEEELGLDW